MRDSSGIGKAVRPPGASRMLRQAQVVAFQVAVVGPPAIQPTVTLKLDGEGDEVEASYLEPYGPTIGDWVWVLVEPGDWLVLGKQATV